MVKRLYYKVIINIEGKLYSDMFYPGDIGCVEYKCGFWVERKPGCGPLCVFGNKKAAIAWIRNGGIKEEVWECEIKKSNAKKIWCDIDVTMLHQLPESTVLANKVKLTRRIK